MSAAMYDLLESASPCGWRTGSAAARGYGGFRNVQMTDVDVLMAARLRQQFGVGPIREDEATDACERWRREATVEWQPTQEEGDRWAYRAYGEGVIWRLRPGEDPHTMVGDGDPDHTIHPGRLDRVRDDIRLRDAGILSAGQPDSLFDWSGVWRRSAYFADLRRQIQPVAELLTPWLGPLPAYVG